MSEFKIIIYTPQELNHASYIHTGLFELEAAGEIAVEVRLNLNKRLGRYAIQDGELSTNTKPHPKTSFYELIDTTTGKKISFATLCLSGVTKENIYKNYLKIFNKKYTR